MTTLLIDDDLGQKATQAAAAQGKTLNEFVQEVLRLAVHGKIIIQSTRNGLPVFDVIPPTRIDSDVVRKFLEEDGV